MSKQDVVAGHKVEANSHSSISTQMEPERKASLIWEKDLCSLKNPFKILKNNKEEGDNMRDKLYENKPIDVSLHKCYWCFFSSILDCLFS